MSNYLQQILIVDLLYMLCLSLILFNLSIVVDLLSLIIIFIKMFTSVSRFQHFQYLYLNISSIQKYYHVVKVLMLNFMIAHIIAILLLLMAELGDGGDDWLTKHGLNNAQWSYKYIWSYYWGVTIMLTVGFGDFAASNKHQALVLVFIQTFSCILLAYNINTVGVILNEIRINQRQRTKKIKVFIKMSQQDKVSPYLAGQMISYIDQSFEIKDKFQYEQYDQIIETLPTAKKIQLKTEAFKQIFHAIPFTNMLSRNGLLLLALKIHRKVAHPEQIIVNKGEHFNMIILKKGKVGLCYKTKVGLKTLHGVVVQTLCSQGKLSDVKLLSLKFLKNQISAYDIKSLDYSVFFHLSMDEIRQCLRARPFDYELLCQLRDKDQFFLSENQVHKCKYCQYQKHDAFNCPRLHYVPISRFVVLKFLKKETKSKQRDRCKRSKIMVQTLKQIFMISEELSMNSNSSQQRSLATLRCIRDEAMNRPKSKKICKRAKFANNSNYIPETPNVNNQIVQSKSYDYQQYYTSGENQSMSGFWQVQSDVASNYRYYLKSGNPDTFFKKSLSQIDKQDSIKNVIQNAND